MYTLNRAVETGLPTNKTILMIDDDEDLLFLMKKRLELEGFTVFISPNGGNMFDCMIAHPPDYILLDIQMNGVEGATICSVIKNNKSTAHIPVILFSANDNIEFISQQCGATTFMKKPFKLPVFKQLLADLL